MIRDTASSVIVLAWTVLTKVLGLTLMKVFLEVKIGINKGSSGKKYLPWTSPILELPGVSHTK
jgi:hypothetical protein